MTHAGFGRLEVFDFRATFVPAMLPPSPLMAAWSQGRPTGRV
jgi:hypothetical protein